MNSLSFSENFLIKDHELFFTYFSSLMPLEDIKQYDFLLVSISLNPSFSSSEITYVSFNFGNYDAYQDCYDFHNVVHYRTPNETMLSLKKMIEQEVLIRY
ncbi:MAG: hypothetical protein ACRC5C_14010 [Bacilli bacterium]